MPTVSGEPEWLKKALDEARRDGRLREGSVPPPAAGPKKRTLGRPEAEFEKAVIDAAHLRGWAVVTIRKVRIARHDGTFRFQTPFGADGKGFFDTLFARDRVFFAELKVHGKWRPEQRAWFERMKKAGQEVYLWRPKHMPLILETLR